MTKILKEQADEAAVITVLVSQIKKLIRLYQIPNIDNQTQIELADWIYENYKWEPFGLIYSVLNNPPATDDKNWRLTPDTIRTWMERALENQAANREMEHQSLKMSDRHIKILDVKEVESIYERLKMPSRIGELARQDMKERKEQYRRGQRVKFTCDGIEIYATDESEAKHFYKLNFGSDPLTTERADKTGL